MRSPRRAVHFGFQAMRLVLAALTALAVGWGHGRADPPFTGTIFLDPDIITPADPTAFVKAVATGRGMRQMFDRRVNNWVNLNAYLFEAHYDDGLQLEVQVNPEFGSVDAARTEAEKYAGVIGRLPKALRTKVATVWIHQGVQPFGGGNHNLLIHVGQAEAYVASGILEEALVHEASHTSLEDSIANTPDWLAAQQADPEFISTYARDNPTREDVAESFLPYLALRYRAGRISSSLAQTIAQTMPHRIAFFDALALDLHPVVYPFYVGFSAFEYDPTLSRLRLSWLSQTGTIYRLLRSEDLQDWQPVDPPVLSQGVITESTVPIQPGAGAQYFRVREL